MYAVKCPEIKKNLILKKLSSVLWYSSLGERKSIWSVKSWVWVLLVEVALATSTSDIILLSMSITPAFSWALRIPVWRRGSRSVAIRWSGFTWKVHKVCCWAAISTGCHWFNWSRSQSTAFSRCFLSCTGVTKYCTGPHRIPTSHETTCTDFTHPLPFGHICFVVLVMRKGGRAVEVVPGI